MQTGKDTTQTHTVSLDSEERAFPDPQWKTGVRARFPWTGFIALSTIILCAVSSVVVLMVSNDKSTRRWPEKIAPSVLLSGFNGIANICFGVAIGNGVAITWWRKALKGATIQDLHRSWTFSSSIKEIILNGKYFNIIALAALAAKLTIIDGMLLQRAANRSVADDPGRNVTVSTYANSTMPLTGVVGDRSGNVTTFFNWFNKDLASWSNNIGIFADPWVSCNGTCLFDIPGTGFEIDCTSEEVAIDYGAAAAQDAYTLSQLDDASTFNSTQYNLLDISFQVFYGSTGVDGDYSRIIMNVSSTNATADENNPTSCPGTLVRHSCILRPAVISYPVTVEDTFYMKTTRPYQNMYLGYNTTFAGGEVWYTGNREYDVSAKQQSGYSVVSYKDVLEDHAVFTGDSVSAIGGIAKALDSYFSGTTSIRYEPRVAGFILDQSSPAGDKFSISPDTPHGCDFNYGTPLDTIVQKINQLMFALTVDPLKHNAENNNYAVFTHLNATQYGTSLHYQTLEGYMWGAFGCMLVCIMCVLPSYYGYWQLGREVTLGPFEIANAFRAPVLDHPAVANAGVKDLIREVGKREVKYGEMVQNDAPGRLAIAEADSVRRVHPRINDTRW